MKELTMLITLLIVLGGYWFVECWESKDIFKAVRAGLLSIICVLVLILLMVSEGIK